MGATYPHRYQMANVILLTFESYEILSHDDKLFVYNRAIPVNRPLLTMVRTQHGEIPLFALLSAVSQLFHILYLLCGRTSLQ